MNTKSVIAAIALACLAAVACIHTLDGKFISDDFILRNVSRDIPLTRLFTSNWLGQRNQSGFYRPVVNVFWKSDWYLYGNSARGYHVTNMLLHILVVLAAALLVKKLQGNGTVAFVTGALFAVHPVHTEAIAWLSGRTDLVAALFYIISLICLVFIGKSAAHPKLFMAAAILSGIAAMLSKEVAFTLPLMATAIAGFDTDKSFRKYRLSVSAMLFATLVLISLIRYLVLGNVIAGYGAARHLRLSPVIFTYLRIYFYWLTVPFTDIHKIPVMVQTILGISIATAFFLCLFFRRTRWVGLWFWITMLPVLNLCRHQYLYLPSLAFAWGIASIATPSGQRGFRIRHIPGIILILCLAAAYISQTIHDNKAWEQSGWVAEAVHTVLAASYPHVPDNTRFIFINSPENKITEQGIFQNGLEAAIRTWYGNPTLRAERNYLNCIADFQTGRDIVLLFRKNKIFNVNYLWEGGRNYFSWPHGDIPFTLDVHSDPVYFTTQVQHVKGLVLYTVLSDSTWIPDETAMADIIITFNDGTKREYRLITGVNTSEWSIDSASTRKIIKHHRAPVAYDYIEGKPGSEPIPGHVYKAVFQWDKSRTVLDIAIIPHLPTRPGYNSPHLRINHIWGIR